MTQPRRIRRAPHHTDRHPSVRPDRSDRAPTPDRSDHSPATREDCRQTLTPRPRRGINRPHPVDQPSEPAIDKIDAEQAAEIEAPLLYTAEQAATLLQVRPSWLRRKAAARAVPCRFIGKHLRFSRADIETIAETGATPQHLI